jgi:sugar (pentulose or hexulose) kinase
MSDPDALLGIDYGTGGAKACLVTTDGVVRGYRYIEYPIIQEHPGWSEHDAENYWTVCCELIAAVLAESGLPASAIAGIAVSSALPSLVLVDAQGATVAPAINLMDRRAVDEIDVVLDAVGAERVADLTANRVEDLPSIVSLLWYRRHRPQIYDRVGKALTIDGFITHRLCGEFVANVSSGVFFGVAYDIRKACFDTAVLDRLGLPAELFPRLADCIEVVGGVTAGAARATGLVAGTPVAAGQVDCNASWVAGGATRPGDMQLNLGTCGVLGVVHDRQAFLGSEVGHQMINIPYTTDPRNSWTAVAATTTGGQALRYFRDTFGALEMRTGRDLGVSAYDLLTVQARDVAPGSEGLIVLPYLMGERSPIWNPKARGVVLGLSLHHTRGHVLRAFLEGVGFALYNSYEQLVTGGISTTLPLVCNEGGARSDVWRRIVTDIFGVPTVLLQGAGGAPLGDAILAGVAVGALDGFDVSRDWAATGEMMEPDTRRHGVYQEYFELYRSVYAHLCEDFDALHRLTRAAGH